MKDLIRMNQLAGLITENQAQKMLNILEEGDNYDVNDGGQGSGSQSMTLKGKKINKNEIKPGMTVTIEWTEGGGSGSGSQSFNDSKGVVKDIDMDYIYLQVDEKELSRQKYNKTYAKRYAKTGIPIPIRGITAVTTS